MPLDLRPAATSDLPAVERLVRDAGLMAEGLTDAFPAGFVVAADGVSVVGCAGVERHGAAGLLRSVVTAPSRRGTGLGRRLTFACIDRARGEGLTALYLLTKTAPSFFRHLGFGSMPRESAPDAVRASKEFAAECCSTAVCLWLPLADALGPGLALSPGAVQQDTLGAFLLAHERAPGEVPVALGPAERRLLDEMPWPLRRAEWLAGRRVAKALLEAAFALAPARTEVLPRESGAPAVWVDGVERPDVVLNLSHTHGYAVAAAARGPVGVDVCDDLDGPRLSRIGRRVFSEGEAEACGAHRTPQTQAAVWALKEAGLKLRIGGVFDPGARSVRVVALEPAQVADASMHVALYRLPRAAVAVARENLSLRSGERSDRRSG